MNQEPRPKKVQDAIHEGNFELLSRAGHAGAKKAAENREKKSELKQVEDEHARERTRTGRGPIALLRPTPAFLPAAERSFIFGSPKSRARPRQSGALREL